MINRWQWFCAGIFACAVAVSSSLAGSAVTNAPVVITLPSEQWDQIEKQHRITLEALAESLAAREAAEQARIQAELSAQRQAELIQSQLSLMREQLTAKQAEQIESLQQSHRVTMMVIGVVAGIGLAGSIVLALLLLRAVMRRWEAGSSYPIPLTGPINALDAGQAGLTTTDPATQSSQQLLGALERIEKRMKEIESANPDDHRELNREEIEMKRADAELAERVSLLLGKGQALLNMQQHAEAMACFDEAIGLDPSNAVAYVKKAVALEKQGLYDDAIEQYDQAIALDDSLTMAYLSKGGILNRLDRYADALKCYEEALRAQQKVRVG